MMRRQSERTRKSRRLFYSVMSHVVSLLARIRIDSSKETITESLGHIEKYVRVDRTYIFKYDFVNQTTSNTHEYCAEGVTSEIDNLQNVPIGFIND